MLDNILVQVLRMGGFVTHSVSLQSILQFMCETISTMATQ